MARRYLEPELLIWIKASVADALIANGGPRTIVWTAEIGVIYRVPDE
jgi:hypothetical protein